MFPPAGATVYYNDAGEPTGWSVESYDPPEPRDPADDPYDPDIPFDVWTDLTDAEIAAQCAEDGSVTVTGVHWKTLRAIERGAQDVTLYSAGRSVYIGTVQDWDTSRAEVTIELR